MKHRRSTGLLLGLSLLVPATPTALAHEFPSPTPVTGVTPLSDQEQYKLAMEHWRIDTVLFKRIASRFTSAVSRAQSIYDAAMLTAPNDRARINLGSRRDSSIEIAIKIRDDAIAEMGGAPVEPTKPVKPQVAATTKKTKLGNPSPTPSP